MTSPGFIPPHGDYEKLISFQKAEIIYDITFRFCQKHLSRGDRTVDQMVQAARSGKQNIAEGVKAAGASKATEIKLLSVARASLEELLVDYKDYLRVRDHPIWDKSSEEALYVRKLSAGKPGQKVTFEAFREFVDTRPAPVIANIAICLIHQANYLLDRQVRAAEEAFIKNGGIKEQMTKARLKYRDNQKP